MSPDADIHPTVIVGPGAIIEADVRIGANTEIGPYSIIRQYTTMGAKNRIDAHVVIGGLPQHTAWDGARSSVVIGDNNTIREFVSIHRAYEEGAETRIGSNCLFMAYAHIGHDCIVGDNVILTNVTQLGGHVEIGNNAIMGGASGAHQFTRVGAFCMVAAHIVLKKDALPYSVIGGTASTAIVSVPSNRRFARSAAATASSRISRIRPRSNTCGTGSVRSRSTVSTASFPVCASWRMNREKK